MRCHLMRRLQSHSWFDAIHSKKHGTMHFWGNRVHAVALMPRIASKLKQGACISSSAQSTNRIAMTDVLLRGCFFRADGYNVPIACVWVFHIYANVNNISQGHLGVRQARGPISQNSVNKPQISYIYKGKSAYWRDVSPGGQRGQV